MDPVVNQINPCHIFITYLCTIQTHLLLCFPSGLFLSYFQIQISCVSSRFPHEGYRIHLSHLPLFDDHNDTW